MASRKPFTPATTTWIVCRRCGFRPPAWRRPDVAHVAGDLLPPPGSFDERCNETLATETGVRGELRSPEPLMSEKHVNRREGRLVIRLFGTLEVEDDAGTLGARNLGGVRPKQVLEILLAARGHRVS